MASTGDNELRDATAAWCDRAQGLVDTAAAECRESLRLVGEGIDLRRRWDRIDRRASERHRLLRLLGAIETICHCRLAEAIECEGEGNEDLARLVVRRVADDDRFLADLLQDHSLPQETVAFCIECFRDDLHWLGTLVAVIDGKRGVDFLGRVFAEEEALKRAIDTWEEKEARPRQRPEVSPAPGSQEAPAEPTEAEPASAAGRTPTAADEEEPPERPVPTAQSLRRSAAELRAMVLVRRVEALLAQEEPTDWKGWYRAWQSASRLETRTDPDPEGRGRKQARPDPSEGGVPEDIRRSLDGFRTRAIDGFHRSVADLPPKERAEALEHVSDDLADAATEAVTFVEDMSLAEAVRSLEVLSEDVTTCLRTLHAAHESPPARLRRKLRRSRKDVDAELQERHLTWRMEGLFGHRGVAIIERSILVLLLLFFVMVLVEIRYEKQREASGPNTQTDAEQEQSSAAGGESSPTGNGSDHYHPTREETIFAFLDLAICLVFLSEFTLKISLVRRRWLFLRRTWLTMLLPSIPFGFFLYLAHVSGGAEEVAEGAVLLRFLRYARLPRMARWLRIARPLVRVGRLVAFSLRASDRLTRQLAPLLNRNLVVFERATIQSDEPEYRTALAALRDRFNHRALEAVAELPPYVHWRLAEARIADLRAMLSSPHVGRIAPAAIVEEPSVRDIPLESVIARLISVTPAGISDRVSSRTVQSVTRWCRAFDVLGFRRLPVIRDLVAAGRLKSPYETTARVANRMGMLLRGLVDRVLIFADLYGIVTPPQLVDSIGERMVRATARPTKRLIMLGLAFLLVLWMASFIPVLAGLCEVLRRLIGLPLIILGLLCAVPLLIGLWFRRIAGEATEFHTLVAEAQFIRATRELKARHADQHHALLHRRVIAPELQVQEAEAERCRQCGADSSLPSRKEDVARQVVEFLWKDYLEGAPLHRTDTKTTTQLLGNLALISLRETRLRYGPREMKRVRQLDLENARRGLGGPYLWFRFISRSIAQHTAKLVLDYNAHSLPLERAATVDITEVHDYIDWLARRLNKRISEIELPEPFRRRVASETEQAERLLSVEAVRRGKGYEVNDFTAVHFLTTDPAIEQDIRHRYGDQVADMMHCDRLDNIRRVFRSYPFHRWPRPDRTINPMVLYQRHLSGGRVLLLPLKLLWWNVVLTVRGLRMVYRIVREVLRPTVGDPDAVVEPDPYAVAVRKIHRMRKPAFLECVRMRAAFDPQYLGVALPGVPDAIRGAETVPVESDLRQIHVDPGVVEEFRELAAQRRQQVRHLRYWMKRLGEPDFGPENLRTMAIAFCLDYRDTRTPLEAADRLRRAFDRAVVHEPTGGRRWWSLRRLCCRLRRARQMRRLFRQPLFRHYDRRGRRICRRLLCKHGGELLDDLAVLAHRNSSPDPVEQAWNRLVAVARDPTTWTHQLIVLRAVQTLTILDLQTYCDVVAELGEYNTASPYSTEGMVSPR